MGTRSTATANVHGILVVSKPAGPTSHDIVALVRRLSGVRRVGHGGTLDPFAMGVLPVFLGRATRMVEYHLADAKAYRCTIAFGARSTTDDIDGELTPGGPSPDRAAVEAALGAFRGRIEQVPPDFSAVHVAGRHAYQLARGGQKPELTPRTVTITELELAGWDDTDPSRPTAVLELRCTAGTYVRALARDLGERLGCGAYLGALTRTASGPFRLDEAHGLEHVRAELAAGRIAELLLPPDAGLEGIPMVRILGRDRAALAQGQVIRIRDGIAPVAETVTSEEGAIVRVVDEAGRLAAMAHLRGGRLYPDKVFIEGSSAMEAEARPGHEVPLRGEA
jgi:tRNA pseudouridine55 synthase